MIMTKKQTVDSAVATLTLLRVLPTEWRAQRAVGDV